jgi:hypothetical protein
LIKEWRTVYGISRGGVGDDLMKRKNMPLTAANTTDP